MQSILKLVEELDRDEQLELALRLINGAKGTRFQAAEVDLSKYAGTVKWPIVAMEYQRQVRAEWDR